MKDPAEIPVWEGRECEQGQGEEAAGSLVAIGDNEEEIPRIAAVPPTTTDSVRSSNSSLTVVNRQERGEREAVSMIVGMSAYPSYDCKLPIIPEQVFPSTRQWLCPRGQQQQGAWLYSAVEERCGLGFSGCEVTRDSSDQN